MWAIFRTDAPFTDEDWEIIKEHLEEKSSDYELSADGNIIVSRKGVGEFFCIKRRGEYMMRTETMEKPEVGISGEITFCNLQERKLSYIFTVISSGDTFEEFKRGYVNENNSKN